MTRPVFAGRAAPFVLRHAPGLSLVLGALICGAFWVGVVIGALAFATH